MALKPNHLTRLYEIKDGKSGWARIWITDDGCISIMSDWGNYGYWFGAPGCEFRRFLIGCDDDYLGNKFGGGRSNQARQFLKHVWPLFVEQLKSELREEEPTIVPMVVVL